LENTIFSENTFLNTLNQKTMKTTTLLMLTLLAGIMACTEEESFKKTLPVQIDAHSHHHGNMHNRNYSTHLNGDQETPPVDTKAQGQAIFHLSKDGETLHYKLIVANIENVTQAHLHRITDPASTTGGVVVWLYPSAPPAQLIPGRSNGPLAEGEITDADLVGSLAGATLADLIDAINDGIIYVNVHTSENPGGEVRGDI
jgi:hypothetical protein